MLGLVVAFLGIFLGQVTGNPVYDGYASIIIGLILGGTAVWLAYETKGLLIGESADSGIVQDVRRIVGAYESVEHVNEVLTLHMGPDFILVNLSLDFADDCQADNLEKTIADMDTRLKQAYPVIKRIFVEAEARKNVLSESRR